MLIPSANVRQVRGEREVRAARPAFRGGAGVVELTPDSARAQLVSAPSARDLEAVADLVEELMRPAVGAPQAAAALRAPRPSRRLKQKSTGMSWSRLEAVEQVRRRPPAASATPRGAARTAAVPAMGAQPRQLLTLSARLGPRPAGAGNGGGDRRRCSPRSRSAAAHRVTHSQNCAGCHRRHSARRRAAGEEDDRFPQTVPRSGFMQWTSSARSARGPELRPALEDRIAEDLGRRDHEGAVARIVTSPVRS
jgi:hypothetical protein